MKVQEYNQTHCNCQVPFIESLLCALSYLTFTSRLPSGHCYHTCIIGKEAEVQSHVASKEQTLNETQDKLTSALCHGRPPAGR